VTIDEDRTAFVEQLDVLIPDRRTHKTRRRVAQSRVETLELMAQARLASDVLRDLEPRVTRAAHRDVRRLRSEIDASRKRAEKKQARTEALEAELRELESRARHAVSYRLHSAAHYVDLDEIEYERLASAQRTSPTLILKKDGRQWWWYRDRFWWDEAKLARRQVAAEILESDLDSSLERHLFEEARDTTIRGVQPATAGDRIADHVRRAVWRRDAGRCADCGSTVDVRFELVVSAEVAEPGPDGVELRCRTCSALRAQSRAGARRR